MKETHPGRYEEFGGQYIPELLMTPLRELEAFWKKASVDNAFLKRFHHVLRDYGGRPTPLTEACNFSKEISGPRIFLKREDLLHTGAHKLNNAIGQCLLAKEMGKTRILAETGAGQHGVATATACAHIGLKCVVYMGAHDIERQGPNVKRMELLGAEVRAVEQGERTLKDAINEALRDWSSSFETSHYCLGSALGPHPYPEIVREFQSVIGIEVQNQLAAYGLQSPDLLVACVGGGSNAIGLFAPFVEDKKVEMIGVEAGGTSLDHGKHAARFSGGSPGVIHGTYTYVLQDSYGQILPTHSISAGLDYPAVGPEHAALHQTKRAQYVTATDLEALNAFHLLSRCEGIIPALESSHALAYLVKAAPKLHKDTVVVVNLSGRGDKDLDHVFQLLKNKETAQ